jgi:3-methylfumaryl-CoA hydratase
VVSAAPLRGLAALLDRPGDPLDVVPSLGHWLYVLPDTPQSAIADDGHPKLEHTVCMKAAIRKF